MTPAPGVPRPGPPKPPPPKPAAKPLARSYTPLKLEVQRAAKELVVDDFVDTYFRERPKTLPELRLEAPIPPEPPPEPRAPVDEESGIRALGATRDEIELSIAEHEEDLIALEAQLAERDEHIESMQGEMLRLQMELEALKRQRSASSRPPGDVAPIGPPTAPEPLPAAMPAVEAPPALAPALEPAVVAAPPALSPSAVVGVAMAGRRRSTAWIVAATASGVCIVGALAALGLRTPRGATTAVASAPAQTAAPASSAMPPRSAHSASAAPVAEGSGSSPSTAPSPPVSAQSATAPGAALPAPSDVEEPGLLSFQAHLTVVSNLDAEVVVQGQPVGRTNQKLLVRCGPRNVRLRDERGWRSAGEHVRITCMHAVTIPIEATP